MNRSDFLLMLREGPKDAFHHLREQTMPMPDLFGITIEKADFTEAGLGGYIFDHVTFRGCTFDRTLCPGTKFVSCTFVDCTFASQLAGATFVGSKFERGELIRDGGFASSTMVECTGTHTINNRRRDADRSFRRQPPGRPMGQQTAAGSHSA